MARPHLDSADFPTLYSGAGQVSNGTVTGTHFRENDEVDIVARGGGGRTWQGQVTTRVTGNTWNATVSPVTSAKAVSKESQYAPAPSPDATETVDVTVTNNDGTSNKVPDDPNIP
jgi:hypothetical protein